MIENKILLSIKSTTAFTRLEKSILQEKNLNTLQENLKQKELSSSVLLNKYRVNNRFKNLILVWKRFFFKQAE